MLAVLITAGGTHLAVLQITAWGTMLASNVQEFDLDDAVDRTFSGDFPCEICKRIALASEKDNAPESTPAPTVTVLDLKLMVAEIPQLVPPVHARAPWITDHLAATRLTGECPHGPPKRLV